MNGLPKKMYYVKIVPGGNGSLRYGQKGGGKYTSKDYALTQLIYLRERGLNAKLYSTSTNWEEEDD